MKWIKENWSKSTLFLALYVTILLVLFVMEKDFALFLIWIQVPVYFLHQFEEYVCPGGFMEFFNTKVLGANKTDFPLTKTVSFWINIPIIFIGFPLSAILSGQIEIAIGIWTAYFSILNALSHVGLFFRNGYNPGLVVSVFLNIPLGIYTIYYFVSHDIISLQMHLFGGVFALMVQGVVVIYGLKYLKKQVQKV